MNFRFLLVALITPAILLGGAERISTVRHGIVRPAHMNQFFSVLTEDLFPRSSFGLVADGGGRLGLGPYRWESLYASAIHFGNIGSFITIDSNGINGADLTATTVPHASLSLPAAQISSSCGASNAISATSFTDFTNLSVTITSTGRPVNIFLQGDGSNPSTILVNGLAASGSGESIGYVRILRNGSEISQYKLGASPAGSSHRVNYFHPPSTIQYFDPVGAGTYTYTVQGKKTSGTATAITCSNAVLVAHEEL